MRKMRETRAVYRARVKRATAMPRATRQRASRPAIPAIDWETRQHATWQELEQWHLWLNAHAGELEQKYAGKYLAIWDSQIIAYGSTWGQAWDAAMIARPDVLPLVTYVPTEAEAVVVL